MAKTVIVVGHTEIDEYGNMLVTDKGGGVTKINKKREHLFPLFQQGNAVELDWQTYMNKDYVADAKLVEQALAPEEPIPSRPNEPPKSSPEIGLAYKELGEMIRKGIVTKDTPEGLACHAKYWQWLFGTLGISVKGKAQPPKRILEEEDIPY